MTKKTVEYATEADIEYVLGLIDELREEHKYEKMAFIPDERSRGGFDAAGYARAWKAQFEAEGRG